MGNRPARESSYNLALPIFIAFFISVHDKTHLFIFGTLNPHTSIVPSLCRADLDTKIQLPIGGWPTDHRMSEVGQYVQLALLNDLEGESPWSAPVSNIPEQF